MNEDTKVPNFEGEKMKMPENTDAQPEVSREPSVVNGPLLLLLAVLLIAILGGMYYWFGTLTTDTPVTSTIEENNEAENPNPEAQIEAVQTVSTSDEIAAIDADVEATNMDGMDAELQAIDAEFEASLQ